ncbi:MAG: sensor domain-containing diguanylate cyclase [Aeromicrobium sp.]|nr:sensor domain-containing diguanylate cyclase [Aeromicrobium sp.]
MPARNSGFVVVCDETGRIDDVLVDNLCATPTLSAGTHLSDLAVASDADKTRLLFEALRTEGSAFGWAITIDACHVPLGVNLNAVVTSSGVLVIGSPSDTEALEMLAEVVRINSELVTHVRGMHKAQQAGGATSDTPDELTHLSRLNNELVGLQRELARKNAELERSRRLVNSIIDIAPTIIYIFDLPSHSVVFASRGVQNILGYTQATGADAFRDLFESYLDEPSRRLRERTLLEIADAADDDLVEWDIRARAADGTWRILHTRETVFARLPDGRVSQIIGAAEDVTEQRAATERLRELALEDQLTGLNNKRGFEFLATVALERAARADEPSGVLFTDLDGFKAVNDELGHAAGDEVLRIFADTLRRCARRSDIIARIGGDEFVVLMTEGAQTGLAALVERLRTELSGSVGPAGRPLVASVGTALGTAAGLDDLHRLVAEADEAMYADKTARRSSDPR